ncbi:P-loop containing nucleoside triphosphate hydrolase protein [Mycena capillaripes]|nr:P-loop containing nucleoside triphosphate hydrolase protein [Mycena capillaripes]
MANQADPWALQNFLSYGTLAIHVPDARDLEQQLYLLNQPLAEDGWNAFISPPLKYLNPEDHVLIRELEVLIAENFLSATFLLSPTNYMIIRLYLIPYDLDGAKGRLFQRPDNIVRPARRCLALLLPQISRSRECWEGRSIPDPALVAPGVTLTGLYEDLPSPQSLVTAASTPMTRRLLDFSDELANLGFRPNFHLHRYQRRSVAAMVQKEMDLTDDPDPLFLPITGMNNEQFFLQPGTMEVLSQRPRVAPCRGGILCEELGTGKTVMILGLILCTINQLSEPESSIMDRRPVLTPLAFRHFPSEEFATARGRIFGNKRKADARTPRVPTLVELLLHKMATSPVTFVPESQIHRYETLKEDVENLEQYLGPRKDNLPFYLDYQGEPIDNERSNKRARPVQRGPRFLYLTSATLVAVPQNLLLQWDQERHRHCEDSLRVRVIRGGDSIPPARVLASEYDIVLISHSHFERKQQKADSTWRACTCPEYPTVRVPKCACKPPDCSPLLQIRWKRLVIDEGHMSASLSTSQTSFMMGLSVERRWVVTGTPTKNLLGLSLGEKVTKASPNEASEGTSSRALSEEPETVYDDGSSSAEGPETADDDDGLSLSAARVWTKEDGADLTNLGNIAQFVGVPQLLANRHLIGTHIKDALLDKRGPRTGAVDVLMQLMSSVMIRHRIVDVEQEVKLPPVTQELVLLDLDPLVIKSYNAMQATIAINAVTSDREGQDYMFHPQNKAFLLETVQNVSQLMFWRVDDNYYNADDQLSASAKLMKQLKPTTIPEDIQLINDSFHHLEIASNDPLWRALQGHEDVPYRVYDLKQPIFEAWTRAALSIDSNDRLFCGYMHPDRLRELRNRVLSQPLISEDALLEAGAYTAEQDAKRRAYMQEELKRKKGSKSARIHKDSANKGTHDSELKPSALVARSYIAHTRLGCSASSKLNFIIDEVLKYSPKEKILIFSESPLSLAHVSEALKLIGVRYELFTTEKTIKAREQAVMTFETSEKSRVFLMELKHGSRGLNLISASRVIFCEPVWRADVESQAIKRCHRIGQTRPITVKTLAIRGTAEETMAARRVALKDSTEKIPDLIYESGMRSFIANPKFLTQTPAALPVVEFPLVKIAPVAEENAPMADVEAEPISPPVRRVHFTADDLPQPSAKRALDVSGDELELSPRKRQVRLLLPVKDLPNSLPKPEPKPRAQVRFA